MERTRARSVVRQRLALSATLDLNVYYTVYPSGHVYIQSEITNLGTSTLDVDVVQYGLKVGAADAVTKSAGSLPNISYKNGYGYLNLPTRDAFLSVTQDLDGDSVFSETWSQAASIAGSLDSVTFQTSDLADPGKNMSRHHHFLLYVGDLALDAQKASTLNADAYAPSRGQHVGRHPAPREVLAGPSGRPLALRRRHRDHRQGRQPRQHQQHQLPDLDHLGVGQGGRRPALHHLRGGRGQRQRRPRGPPQFHRLLLGQARFLRHGDHRLRPLQGAHHRQRLVFPAQLRREHLPLQRGRRLGGFARPHHRHLAPHRRRGGAGPGSSTSTSTACWCRRRRPMPP